MKHMKVVIFGLGSMGRRHARILRDGFPHEVYAFRSKAGDRRKNGLGIPEVHTWEQVRALKPDVAFITGPTFSHVKTAQACASLGMHLFIEKPLSNSLQGIAALEAACRKKNITCYVAYGLRFHPVIKALRRMVHGKKIYHVRITCSSYLPFWRKGTDSKDSYSAKAAQGGGVLLDLSHEFDYIKYLFGDIHSVSGFYGRVSAVSRDAEDFADVLLKTRHAPYVNLHLNFLSLMEERRIIIDHKNGCMIGDLVGNKIELLGPSTRKTKRFKTSRDGYLKEQARYFFANIRNSRAMNGLEESKGTLRQILEFKEHG